MTACYFTLPLPRRQSSDRLRSRHRPQQRSDDKVEVAGYRGHVWCGWLHRHRSRHALPQPGAVLGRLDGVLPYGGEYILSTFGVADGPACHLEERAGWTGLPGGLGSVSNPCRVFCESSYQCIYGGYCLTTTAEGHSGYHHILCQQGGRDKEAISSQAYQGPDVCQRLLARQIGW